MNVRLLFFSPLSWSPPLVSPPTWHRLMYTSQHWQTNSDKYILISTLPGLVTEDCLSPKDFSFLRGRSWQWELSGKDFHKFLGKTCSGEITEDWVRIFGCEFFLLNGRSLKFPFQQIFQPGFKPQAFQMTWIGSMAGGRSLILPEMVPLGKPEQLKTSSFPKESDKNVEWEPKHDFESDPHICILWWKCYLHFDPSCLASVLLRF